MSLPIERVRIATRESRLALAQTRWVAARLKERWPGLLVEELPMTTKGDQILDQPLAKIGGKGLFIGEVERALVEGRAELAVHSVKDIPESLAEGMGLLAVPEREDPRDVLVHPEGLGLYDLPAGAVVGTSSLRRACQLKAARPDLAFAVLRGNVDTRLRKLDEGGYDAIVLAYAGMRRLELDRERKVSPLPSEQCLHAVGQGALGIEGSLEDGRLRVLLSSLEDKRTRIQVEAERAFLARLQGGCSTPLAASARMDDPGRLRVDGMVGSLDGERILRASVDCYLEGSLQADFLSAAHRSGVELAENLLARGAGALLEEAKKSADPYAHGLYVRASPMAR